MNERQALPPGGQERSRLSDRRQIAVGLGLSALVHLVAIFLYPLLSGPPTVGPISPYQPLPQVVEGTTVIQLVEVAGPDPGDPDDPSPLLDPSDPEVEVVTPDLEGHRSPLAPRYRTAAERLRAGQGDPRLWSPVSPEVVAPTELELLQFRLLAAIEEMNDSAAAEALALLESMDWTHTDDEGKKWGVSPGKIHLGDITIPLPFGFGPPPDYNGDQAERAFRLADIERAAGTRAAQLSWNDRREAMRQRREERRAREEAEKASPPVVKPDTTSAR